MVEFTLVERFSHRRQKVGFLHPKRKDFPGVLGHLEKSFSQSQYIIYWVAQAGEGLYIGV